MKEKMKCSSKEHSQIIAIKYCQKCEIYMCNKCDKMHSSLLPHHQCYKINNDLINIFREICTEEKHNQKLEYFCKTHNKPCCAFCITKIYDKGKGQHKDCDICIIENIMNEKKNQLKQNIQILDDLYQNFTKSINELKQIFKKINENKDELKSKIKKIFKGIRI